MIWMSDLHGNLPKIEEPVDLIGLCGDIISLRCQRDKQLTEMWFLTDFVEWVNSIPFKYDGQLIWIAGNHELGFYNLPDRKQLANKIYERTNGRAIYLEDSVYTFKNIKIYGTPWCTVFGNWAFMLPSQELTEKFSLIPDDVDILLTHDAPYGTSDLCFGWNCTPEHIGNKPLRDAILKKNPKYNFHGHLHTSNHDEELLGNTKVYCVSLLDEKYSMSYKPLCLTV